LEQNRRIIMKYRMGAKAGKLARMLAVVAIVMVSVMTVLISGGVGLADSPDTCWRIVPWLSSTTPTLTYNESVGYYFVSNSPFRYDSKNYAVTPYGVVAWVYAGPPYMLGMGPASSTPISTNGTEDIDVSLYSTLVNMGGFQFPFDWTVYYQHGNQSAVAYYFDLAVGVGNWSCDVTFEGVFVNESGSYVYHAPTPTCDPIPVPTVRPIEGNRSTFILPETNVSAPSPVFYAVEVMNQSDGGLWTHCEAWQAIWDSGMMIYGYPPYSMVAEQAGNFGGTGNMATLSRLMLAYNTSSIPDDAIITGAFLRVVPAYWMAIGEDTSDIGVVLGGTHNTSIFPFGMEMMSQGYSESEFYGDFGGFSMEELLIPPAPIGGMPEMNPNESLYTDVGLNEDGIAYINKSGLTVLSLRTERDANNDCPEEYLVSGGGVVAWTMDVYDDEPVDSPNTVLMVDWHMPGDEPIPSGDLLSPQVAVMMDIIAILFLTGGIIGLLFVVAKSDGMSVTTKAGVITTIAVMAVVGVIIIESLVVAFK
jgi:hypothetical protein